MNAHLRAEQAIGRFAAGQSPDDDLAAANDPAVDAPAVRLWPLAGAALLSAYWVFANSELRLSGEISFEMNWQVVVRLVVVAACGAYGVFALPRTLPKFFGFAPFLLGCFLYWGAVTILFSLDAAYSVATLGTLGCLALMAPAVLDSLGADRALRWLVFLSAAFLVGCWGTYYLFPELGRDQYFDIHDDTAVDRLAGLSHPNRVGRLAAACAGLATAAWLRGSGSWRTMAPIILLGIASAAGTQSRTAVIVTLVAIGLPVARRIGFGGTAVMVSFLAPLALVAATFYAEDAARAAARSGRASEIYELNGRVPLWRDSVAELWKSPVYGYGYGCQRFVVEPLGYTWAVEPHNLWLNVGLNVGFLGVMIFAILTIGMGWGFVTRPSDVPDVIFLLVMLDGVTSSCLFGAVPNGITFLWLIAIFWRRFDETTPTSEIRNEETD